MSSKANILASYNLISNFSLSLISVSLNPFKILKGGAIFFSVKLKLSIFFLCEIDLSSSFSFDMLTF